MINVWFISDTHFGHKNILEYEKEARPFSCIEEMHEVMIERWNNVVATKDTVYHLGDFAFGRHNIKIASRLNGCKKLVMGNHDTYPTAEYLEYFDKLYGVVFYERCVLSHMPVHPNGLGARWMMNIHGHLHSKRVRYPILSPDDNGNLIYHEDNNYFNVSCEQNNLTPIHRDVVMERLKEL
jgi:calcineurin-like phosphoesterase family protein